MRLWHSDFAGGVVDALKARVAAGPTPLKAQAALRVATPLLQEPVGTAQAGRWRGSSARSREGKASASFARNSPKCCVKNFRWRRPRYCLKNRQDAEAVAQIGLRLQLRKAQAKAGDVVLLNADRSEALTHPYLAKAWAERGAGLRVPAPGQARKVALMGAFDPVGRRLVVHTGPTARSTNFIAFLQRLDALYGPRPDSPGKPVVIALDNGPIHISRATRAALVARAHWLIVEWLPKYAPELNYIERVWHDLKAHHIAHQTFVNAQALDSAIHRAVEALNTERVPHPLGKQRVPA